MKVIASVWDTAPSVAMVTGSCPIRRTHVHPSFSPGGNYICYTSMKENHRKLVKHMLAGYRHPGIDPDPKLVEK